MTFETADFYCCYLLRSVTKARSFYIGSTPDPVRRLRQHNGELKGGAWRTAKRGCGPWEVITLVYGFPSNVAALQFEHAFQHAHQTRHIPEAKRITKSKTAGQSLAFKLGNVRLLLASPFFSRMNLKVQLFDPEAYATWCANRFGVRLSDLTYVDHSVPAMAEFLARVRARETTIFEQLKAVMAIGCHPCGVCGGDVDYTDGTQKTLVCVCYHSECRAVAHLTCMGRRALTAEVASRSARVAPVLTREEVFAKLRHADLSQYSQASRNLLREQMEGLVAPVASYPVIPLTGLCVGCGRVLVWLVVAKNATRLRKWGAT